MENRVALPDFDDMIELANRVGRSKSRLLLAKAELDQMLAEITEMVTENPEYWIGGKPPSNAHVKSTYHILGCEAYNKEILYTLRNEIADLEGKIKTDDILIHVYRDMIDVWRTQSANERGAFLE